MVSLLLSAHPNLLAGGDLAGLFRLYFDRGEDAVDETVKNLLDAALNRWKSRVAELRAGETATQRGDQGARR